MEKSKSAQVTSQPDNWRDIRSMACINCMYFVDKAVAVGRCRRHAPVTNQGWPVVYTSDWCGDFKLVDARRR